VVRGTENLPLKRRPGNLRGEARKMKKDILKLLSIIYGGKKPPKNYLGTSRRKAVETEDQRRCRKRNTTLDKRKMDVHGVWLRRV